jgi:hypothetical protein
VYKNNFRLSFKLSDLFSLQSLLYTLGLTALDAAYYNTITYGEQPLSTHLKRVLGALIEDDQDDRPEVATVIAECEQALEGDSSKDICRDLARSAIDIHSGQGG